MSLLDDARQLLSGQDPRRNSTQLPPRGGAPRMEPSYVTGALEAPGGDRAQRVSSMYDAALKTREGERAAGILNAPALTSPVTENIPETSELSEATGYLGMGSKALSTGAEIANFADAPAVSSALETAGKVAGGVAGVFGAGVSAYNIAKGEGNPNDYMNVARTAAPYVKDVATTLAPEAMKTLTSVIPSGVASAVSIAAPYYALAKAGGMAINMITANNPKLRDTPLGLLGEGLKNPITGVERSIGAKLAEKGIGDRHTNNTVAALFNPGGILEELGLGTWICTAVKKHTYLTNDEEDVIAKLRVYAKEKHNKWFRLYLVHGMKLVNAIAKQEKDLKEFYTNIREILVKPVTELFDKDNEAAYQLYHKTTELLRSKYLPELIVDGGELCPYKA